MFKKTSLLVTVVTLTFGVTATISSNSVLATDIDHPKHHFRNHKNKHKPHKPISKKHSLKHKHVKHGDRNNLFTYPEQSNPSGGCPGECRKS